MVIIDLSDEKHKTLRQTIRYRGVELRETKSIPYDEKPMPFQRQIEMSVTNGKGYLSIQNALDIVNRESPQLNLHNVLDAGLIPLYFKEYINSTRPCGEIPLSESSPCRFSVPKSSTYRFPFSEKTFLEQLEMEQRKLWIGNIKRDMPYTLFKVA